MSRLHPIVFELCIDADCRNRDRFFISLWPYWALEVLALADATCAPPVAQFEAPVAVSTATNESAASYSV